MTNKKRKIHLAVTNDLYTDNRVHKIASSLTEIGYEVTLTGRLLSNSPPIKKRSYTTRRMKLLFSKGPLFYAEYNFRLILYLFFNNYNILVANDLDTLPACALIKRIKRCKLAYDSHELFTEVPELVNRKRVQWVWKYFEKISIPKVDVAYTVCQSIANHYHSLYSKEFNVIRNLPQINTNHIIPKKHLLTTNKKIVLYQGALNVGRGLQRAIKAMRWVNEAQLYIAGEGDITPELKQLVEQLQLNDRVFFLGRIPIADLHFITQQATIGISLEEDRGLNYRYALPNKIFDYIQAEVPILTSNLPEMRAIVEEYSVGVSIPHNASPHEVSIAINNLIETKCNYKKALKSASRLLVWESEKEQLKNMFNL